METTQKLFMGLKTGQKSNGNKKDISNSIEKLWHFIEQVKKYTNQIVIRISFSDSIVFSLSLFLKFPLAHFGFPHGIACIYPRSSLSCLRPSDTKKRGRISLRVFHSFYLHYISASTSADSTVAIAPFAKTILHLSGPVSIVTRSSFRETIFP